MLKLDVPKSIQVLIIGGFIQSVGHSFMWPLNSLFMHNVLGRSLTEAGTMMALQAAVMLVGQFISGFLADRFGPRKIMLGGLAGAIFSVGLIGVFPVWAVYAPGFLLFGLSVAFIFVPLNTLTSVLWPEGGRRGFNLLYVFNNAGVAVGTSIGGLIASVSFRLTFLLNAVTFTIYLLLVLFGIPGQVGQNIKKSNQKRQKNIVQDKGFGVLLTLSSGIFLVWAAYIQLSTILPVVMNKLGFSLSAYSILWTLNGVFIVTLQPVIHLVVKHWASTFIRQFYLACILISLAFLILLGQFPYFSYIIAMLVLTLGEMLILPAVPAAAAQVAPSGKEGVYQGIVGSASSGGRVVGPFLGGIVYDYGGGTYTWFLALGFMATAFIAFFLYAWAEHKFKSMLA